MTGNDESGQTSPLWTRDNGLTPEHVASAPQTLSADVVVIGAGIAGLSVAYQLLQSGRQVVVVDRLGVGCGETSRSSAHLADAVDDHYYILERAHGVEGARLIAESHRAGIESIAQIVQTEGIDCDFRYLDGYLFTYGDDSPREVERELVAARRAGLNVEASSSAPLPFQTGVSLRFANQAEFDPMAYVQGLARAVERLGGKIFCPLAVEHIDSGEPARVTLSGDRHWTAKEVVVATNVPFHHLVTMHSKQAAYRSYMLAIAAPKGELARALFWDMRDPYHYIRWVGEDTLLIGGEDHGVGKGEQSPERWDALERWAREHIPLVGEVRSRWSGQVIEPMDGVAFIGRDPGMQSNGYLVTGDSGNGLTHAALAGLLIRDLICGRENPWSKVYDPSRKVRSLQAARTFVQDNVGVAASYTDWLRPSRPRAVDIQPGQGAVVQHGLHKLAIYVDEAGERHTCSAVCPHLAGVVHWNAAEKSWDCPCHGSRFSPIGELINGPANQNLPKIDDEPRGSHKAEPLSAQNRTDQGVMQ